MTDPTPGPAAPTADALGVLRPLGHGSVRLGADGWLGQWQVRNRDSTLPHVLKHIEHGEAATNLARVVGESDAPFTGMVFTDSDVYKALEAVAWSSADVDPDVLGRAEQLVALLERVQDEDGYLNSHVQGDGGPARFADPQWGHELYCAGHLFQAAVAAARTGSLPALPALALRFADMLVRHFADGHDYVEGHPEVETALVELYRATGRDAYLELAVRQLEARGHGWLGPDRFGSQYFQDHRPVRAGAPATGHAVRQLYLLTGAVDVAVETGDTGLLDAVRRTYADLFDSKTYISGAHGSRHRDEAIGDPYELPPDRAYAETCAAIASFQLSWRLLLATGDLRYADEMETVLHNAIAVSTSQSGTEFFYSNPLQLRQDHDGGHEDAPTQRLPWFACACCPPNIARLLATAHDYLATTDSSGVQLQLYADGDLRVAVPGGTAAIGVRTRYPFDGRVDISVNCDSEQQWALQLRVPGWCRNHELSVDGEPVPSAVEDGRIVLTRHWAGTQTVRLDLDVPVRTVTAHPRVDAVRGCVAVLRGPVLFAVEQADLPADVPLETLVLTGVDQDVNGWPVLTLRQQAHADALYTDEQASDDARDPEGLRISPHPYALWANRTAGAMRVWLPARVG